MRMGILSSLAALVCLISSTQAFASCPTLFNFYAHATDCDKFYRCVWGEPMEFNCPAGTHWNQEILTCDHAYNVPCPAHIYAIGNERGYEYKDPAYGYVTKDYETTSYPTYAPKQEHGDYVTKGSYPVYATNPRYPVYEKSSYESYPNDNGYVRYGGNGNYGYVSKVNNYEYKNNYWGTLGRQTRTPGHNYGGFQARTGYPSYSDNTYNKGYARIRQYVKPRHPYGGYVAGGYASKAASGYERAVNPVVGNLFGRKYWK